MSAKPKIMVFAPNIVWQQEFRKKLESLGILVFSVYTPGSARLKLEENTELDLIIIVPSILEDIDKINVFLREMYCLFSGMVIGVSNKTATRRKLMRAGCSRVCDEQGLLQLVKEIVFL